MWWPILRRCTNGVSDIVSQPPDAVTIISTIGGSVNITKKWLSAGLVVGALFAGTTLAEEVTLSHGGVKLNANLALAPGKTLAAGVVLITHGTLAHNGMETISALQQAFKDQGRNTLAINLSLGLDNRHGMYECATPHTHRHTDALDEIGAWLGWLKQQGAKEVVLLGHSRGGNQTAWFAAERPDPAVKAVVLLAPMTWSEDYAAKDYQTRYGKPLKPALERAQTLVKAGKGGALLQHTDFIYCTDTSANAAAFVSYYAPDLRQDTPHLLPKIARPTLVIAGSEDTVVADIAQKTQLLADGKRLQLKVIEGADHFFRDLYADEVAEAVGAFLGGT